MEKSERRWNQTLEVRAAGETSSDLVLVGYAAKFDVETMRWPGSFEVVRRGAFTETIKNDDPIAYWVHEKREVLGRKSSGTLTLMEDAIGLFVEIRMANTVINQNYYESVRRGDVRGMSFGFFAHPDGQIWSVRADGSELRELTRVMLVDVGPHPDPQYVETEIEARSKWDANRPKPQSEAPATVPVEVEHAQARVILEGLLLTD